MEWPTEGGNGIPEYGGPTRLTLGFRAWCRRSRTDLNLSRSGAHRSGNSGLATWHVGEFLSVWVVFSQDPNDARTVLSLSRDSLQYVCLYGV